MKAVFCAFALIFCGQAMAEPEMLADRQSAYFTVSDGKNLYWSNNVGSSGGSIMTVPVAGGLPSVVTLTTSPRRLRLHEGTLYWADTSSGSIRSVSTAGGALKILASNQNHPMGLVIYKDYIYWTNAGVGMPNGSVVRMPIAGGTPEVLAENQEMPMGLAVAKDTVYWSNVIGKHAIFSLSLKDKSVNKVIGAYVPSMAMDEENIYWVDMNTGDIAGLRVADGKITTLASNQYGPSGLFVDEKFIYWTTSPSTDHARDAKVMKAPLAGGAAVVLADAQRNPFGISTDQENIYWSDLVDQMIFKLKK